MGRPRKDSTGRDSFLAGGDNDTPARTEAESQPPAFVEVGDFVLYAHRRPRVGNDGNDFKLLPMLVTEVLHDGQTIGGIVFSNSQLYCSTGSKPVNAVPFGGANEGGGTWRHR